MVDELADELIDGHGLGLVLRPMKAPPTTISRDGGGVDAACAMRTTDIGDYAVAARNVGASGALAVRSGDGRR